MRKVESCLLCATIAALVSFLLSCGGSGSSDSEESPCEVGGLTIEGPTYDDSYTTSDDSIYLSGFAPLASGYVTGSSNPGTVVTWDNTTTGDSGTALSIVDCYLDVICTHDWFATIDALVIGENTIEVSAHENGVLVGRDCITITYESYEPSIPPLWIHQFDTADYDIDVGRGIAVDANGNSYITGFTQERSYPIPYGFIAKYDTSGNQLWKKDTSSNSKFAIDLDADGNSYISGYGIAKYDTSGNQLWEINDFALGFGIKVAADGTSYIAGSTNWDFVSIRQLGIPDPWESNALIAKYDTSGNQLWEKQFGTSNHEVGRAIAVDVNGNSYITGHTDGDLAGTGNAGEYDIFIAKYDTSGNQLWIKQYGKSLRDIAYGVAVDSSGSSYITGYTEKDVLYKTLDQLDVFIAKYDTYGNKLWVKELFTTGEYDEVGYGIAIDSNDDIYITGYTKGNIAGTGNAGRERPDVFIYKFDTNGSKIWIRQYGTSNADKAYSIAVDSIGQSFITGYWDGDINDYYESIYECDVFIMGLPY